MSGLRALAGAALLLAAGQAWADDSTASLGIGGVELTRAADIRMAKEDLFVSPEKVRIRFEFANDSARDIDVMMAFPLPDIETCHADDVGAVTGDPQNFVGFRVVADSRPVTPRVDQRAFLKGEDVTALLAATGAPLNPLRAEAARRLQKLAPAARERLCRQV